ncbi:MAG: MerR family transcriptional regulator [Candidatus Dojkabacteria bacterium]|nr:MerR family transcriptional regulator [Candidatus Dojkabacteria bacterium]
MAVALDDKPLFTTGVVSGLLGINPKTLINYENAGLLRVHRTMTGRRLFSRRDILRILIIKYLINKKDVCFDGIKLTFDILREGERKGIDLLPTVVPDPLMKRYVERVKSI